MLQHPTKGCSSASILDSLRECKRAKAAFDTSTASVSIVDNQYRYPKGCSHNNKYGSWVFNTAAKGKLDGNSEPVCKTAAGKANRILRGRFLYVLYINTFFCMHSSCPNYH